MFEITHQHCLSFPSVVAEEKWDNDLRFSVGGKIFCMLNNQPPYQISFKCEPDQFHRLIARPGIEPTPFLARYHWVQVRQADLLEWHELQSLIQHAYEMVVQTLPPEERDTILKQHA